MAKPLDVHRPGSDGAAFAFPDGKPLSAYLGWLWYETRELRRFARTTKDSWTLNHYADAQKKGILNTSQLATKE